MNPRSAFGLSPGGSAQPEASKDGIGPAEPPVPRRPLDGIGFSSAEGAASAPWEAEMKTPMKTGPARRQAGMTLIEVLVAVLIFSLGILGLIGLQSRAVQFSVSAEDTNRAAMLAGDIVGTMWAQGTASVAPADYAAWQARVADPRASGLPNGVGQVDVAGSLATITIRWRANNAASSPQNENRYVTQATIQP